jgi:predicted CopG family antitoxin
MDKIKTSISLDKEVYEKIKQLSKQEDRSFSQQVNKILKLYLTPS